MSCSGGMSNADEGWYIKPDFANNRCILELKEPSCESGSPEVEYQRIIAICYKKLYSSLFPKLFS